VSLTWDQIEAQTKISGERLLYSEQDCKRAAAELGLAALPPSYVQYVARFGIGQWEPDFTIAVPRHRYPALTLKNRVFEYKKALECVLKEFPTFSKDVNVLKRLLCIGGSGNGFELCWDTQQVDRYGEMPLCLVTHEESEICYCGSNLLEFIGDFWIGKKIDTACSLNNFSWNSRAEFTVLDES